MKDVFVYEVPGCVRTADMSTAPTSQPEKKPQNSNGSRRAPRRRARWCPLCGHQAAGVIESGAGAAVFAALPRLAPVLLLDWGQVALTHHRLRPTSASGWPTERGWGCTGQGLCMLHEPPHLMEYTRPLPSSARPSCSAGGASGSAGVFRSSPRSVTPGQRALPASPSLGLICLRALSRPGGRRARRPGPCRWRASVRAVVPRRRRACRARR